MMFSSKHTFFIRLVRLKAPFLLLLACAGCASLSYHEFPPATPIPLAPASSSVVINQSDARFLWRESENAEYYDFHIFNRANSDISTYYLEGLDPEEICAQRLCELTLELLLPVRKGHAWRVRAGNFAGNSAWTRIEFEAAN